MVFIRISRNNLKIFLGSVLIIVALITTVSLIQNNNIATRYKSFVCFSNQYAYAPAKLVTYLLSIDSSAAQAKTVEIFDIATGKVVKNYPSNCNIRVLATGYLNNITGVYVKAKAIPDKGFIVRIPLDPNVKVKNSFLNDYNINTVNEFFVIFPENENPYLLVLDKDAKPFFYNFTGDTNELLNLLDYP